MNTPRWISQLALTLAAFVLLVACIGGTGSDHENGVVIEVLPADANLDNSSSGVTGPLTLRIFAADYIPGEKTTESVLKSGRDSLQTDAKGNVKFAVRKAGVYLVEATGLTGTVLIDTLKVNDISILLSKRFIPQPTSPARWKIKIESGKKIDSGWVYLRGTRFRTKVEQNGEFSFGNLPQGVLNRVQIGVSKLMLSNFYTDTVTGISNSPNPVDTTVKVPILDTSKTDTVKNGNQNPVKTFFNNPCAPGKGLAGALSVPDSVTADNALILLDITQSATCVD